MVGTFSRGFSWSAAILMRGSSHLQDVVCCGCAALLGLRCTQTPVNHVLDEYVRGLRNTIYLQFVLTCDTGTSFCYGSHR